MVKFEVGKEYYTRSICDHNCIFAGVVVGRTAQTITLNLETFGVKKLRVIQELSEINGAETVRPLGRFSMAPTISAKDKREM